MLLSLENFEWYDQYLLQEGEKAFFVEVLRLESPSSYNDLPKWNFVEYQAYFRGTIPWYIVCQIMIPDYIIHPPCQGNFQKIQTVIEWKSLLLGRFVKFDFLNRFTWIVCHSLCWGRILGIWTCLRWFSMNSDLQRSKVKLIELAHHILHFWRVPFTKSPKIKVKKTSKNPNDSAADKICTSFISME